MSNRRTSTSIQMISDYDGDLKELLDQVPSDEVTPILATRNMVLFPGVIVPIMIGRKASVSLIKRLKKNPEKLCAVFCQKDASVESPKYQDLYTIGVYARLMKVLEMPDGKNYTAIVQGLGRCHLDAITKTSPYLQGKMTPLKEELIDEKNEMFSMAFADLKQKVLEYIHKNEEMPDETSFAFENVGVGANGVNYFCTNLPLPIPDKIALLEEGNELNRTMAALKTVKKQIVFLDLRNNIQTQTKVDIDEQQKEYFLQQEIKNIRE